MSLKLAFLASAESIHSAKWINYFVKKGHRILWISYGKKTQEIDPSIEFVDLSQDGLFKQILKTRALLKSWKPDVLHVHSVGTYGLIALYSAPKHTKLISTPWGSDVLFGKKNPLKRFFISKVLNRSSLITTDARFMIDEISALGSKPDNCKIINFGIDTDKFRFYPLDNEVLSELGLLEAKQNGPLVVSTRNFEPVYDVATFLKAIPEILKEVPHAFFPIIGKGSLTDELKSLAQQLGISNKVKFLGYIPNKNIPTFLSNTNVYVSTSLSDAGIASSTAEAMACGVPVVITDAAENSFWVQEGRNGMLFQKGNFKELAQKVVFILKNESLVTEFSKQGRATILEKNDYLGEMNKMDQLYRSIR